MLSREERNARELIKADSFIYLNSFIRGPESMRHDDVCAALMSLSDVSISDGTSSHRFLRSQQVCLLRFGCVASMSTARWMRFEPALDALLACYLRHLRVALLARTVRAPICPGLCMEHWFEQTERVSIGSDPTSWDFSTQVPFRTLQRLHQSIISGIDLLVSLKISYPKLSELILY